MRLNRTRRAGSTWQSSSVCGPSRNDNMEYLVIGAGPAGLQLGNFLERAGRDYLILEAGASPGTSSKPIRAIAG